MNRRVWVACSGFMWLFVGVMLLYKGLHLIQDAVHDTDSLSYRFGVLFGNGESGGTVWVAMGLMIGFLKGRYVLSKTVSRLVKRIEDQPLPLSFFTAYPLSYWVTIVGMMGLGLLLRLLPIHGDVRGLIDTAVGSALIQGAMLYFRASRGVKASHS